jgi:hypothetical protein
VVAGVPNTERAVQLSRRLADTYPESSQAATALFRVAEAEAQAGRKPQSLAVYRRVLSEYPHSDQTEAAAEALSRAARDAGKLEQARNFKRQALRAAEYTAREQFPGKALPAKSTLSVMGFRIDLSGLELQLNRVSPARELAAIADREAARLGSIRALDQNLKNDLKDRRERLEEVRNELWVADMFEAVKVELPGLAPRAREFPVSGSVQFEGRPLEGVEVVLAGGGQDLRVRRFSRQPETGPATFRAVTDRRGRYTITGVPAGSYFVAMLFPVTSPSGVLIQPDGVAPLPEYDFSLPVVVDDQPVKLPPLTFRRALVTRTFGELPPVGKALRLEWEKWPGAVTYEVRVLPVRDLRSGFEKRVPEEKRDEFKRDPVLWSQADLKETQAECPLLNLAPDQPPTVLAAQYEYQVTAYDAKKQPLATNSRPLSRFYLSPAARETLLKQKPPVRGGPRRRRGPRAPQRPRQ